MLFMGQGQVSRKMSRSTWMTGLRGPLLGPGYFQCASFLKSLQQAKIKGPAVRFFMIKNLNNLGALLLLSETAYFKISEFLQTGSILIFVYSLVPSVSHGFVIQAVVHVLLSLSTVMK